MCISGIFVGFCPSFLYLDDENGSWSTTRKGKLLTYSFRCSWQSCGGMSCYLCLGGVFTTPLFIHMSLYVCTSPIHLYDLLINLYAPYVVHPHTSVHPMCLYAPCTSVCPIHLYMHVHLGNTSVCLYKLHNCRPVIYLISIIVGHMQCPVLILVTTQCPYIHSVIYYIKAYQYVQFPKILEGTLYLCAFVLKL